MSRTDFTVNPHSAVAWMSTNSLHKTGALSKFQVTATRHEPTKTYLVNKISTIWSNWPKNWAELCVFICMVHLTVSYYHVTHAFQSESTPYICLNIKNPFLLTGAISEIQVTATGIEASTTYLKIEHSTIRPYSLNDCTELWVRIHTEHLTVCCYHVTYAFHTESTLCICFNVKEILGPNRSDSWDLSDWNGTQTHNRLLLKKTMKHLAKQTKWLSWILRRCL